MRRRDRSRSLAIAIVLVGVWWAPAPARAANAVASPPSAGVALPEPLTRDAIRELVARLSDSEVRALLLAQLDKTASPSAESGGGAMPMTMRMLGRMEGETNRLRDRLRETLAATSQLPGVPAFVAERLTEGRRPSHLLVLGLTFAGMLVVGWGTERLFVRLAGDVRRRLAEERGVGVAAQAGRLLLRLVLEVLAVVLFGSAALVVLLVASPRHEPSRWGLMAYLAATMILRLTALAGRFLLAPAAPNERLLSFDDAGARRLYGGVVRLATVFGFGMMTVALLQHLGLAQDVGTLLSLIAGLLFTGLLLQTIWQTRAAMATMIEGGRDRSALRRGLADLWPVLGTIYALGVFLAWAGELLSGHPMMARQAALGSLLLVVVLPLADLALCWVVAATLERNPDAAGESSRAMPPGYAPVLRRGVHIVVTGAGLVLLARLWGLDLFLLADRSIGERFARALIDVALTLLLAHLAWELVRTAIDRRLARETPSGPAVDLDTEGGGGPGSRLRTLLPLLRMFLSIAIAVMAAMLVLAGLGVNIGPLLAGAGVVGLALGFGAQTLVRDVISGAFFLLDDAFRLGEYIDAGQVKGIVEKLSIRSMQIRHHRGALHTVPFGEIKRLTNHSRDWVIVKLEFRLTYDTDPITVKKILKQIGQELAADPELGPNLLQPLKSQGVMATEESALVIRAKFMAKPGTEFLIQREAYNRILKAFAEKGVKFAHRQVTVFVPPTAGPAAAVAGAAAAVAGEGAATAGSPSA